MGGHTDNYYAILGLASGPSSREDIRKAYRALAVRYHPDKTAGDAQATARFLKIQQAYEVLGDKAEKYLYDTYYYPKIQSQEERHKRQPQPQKQQQQQYRPQRPEQPPPCATPRPQDRGRRPPCHPSWPFGGEGSGCGGGSSSGSYSSSSSGGSGSGSGSGGFSSHDEAHQPHQPHRRPWWARARHERNVRHDAETQARERMRAAICDFNAEWLVSTPRDRVSLLATLVTQIEVLRASIQATADKVLQEEDEDEEKRKFAAAMRRTTESPTTHEGAMTAFIASVRRNYLRQQARKKPPRPLSPFEVSMMETYRTIAVEIYRKTAWCEIMVLGLIHEQKQHQQGQ